MGSILFHAALMSLLLAAMTIDETQLVKAVQPERDSVVCTDQSSPCFGRTLTCLPQCPHVTPSKPSAKTCLLDCNSPKCEALCKNRRPNCNGVGAACLDPRFIGGDGVVFYFHGRKNDNFALVSDPKFQINARFIGLRPEGRNRDFTWIQALGIMFGGHTLTVDSTRASRWVGTQDHLKFSFDGQDIEIPEGHRSRWTSTDGKFIVERVGGTNSVVLLIEGIADVSVNVVPISEEDNKVHNYQIPEDDCFAHLDVQFRFHKLSENMDGVLGRTYRLNYESNVKAGVAMPVLGGEDKYRTSSLLTADCGSCVFDSNEGEEHGFVSVGDH